MTHHRFPPSSCPFCLKAQDTASMPDSSAPVPGDIAFCLDCGELAVFDADMIFRKPTEAELAELAGQPAFLERSFQVASFRAYRASTPEDVEAMRKAAIAMGGVCELSQIMAVLGWDKAKAYAVMRKLEEQGIGVAVGVPLRKGAK
jgi:hypothetical protein